MIYKVLSIAGFDGSAGAGNYADIKTFSALGCYGVSVLTALPIQNTCGVRNCYEIPIDAIQEQLEVIFDDIRPNSIKIGMLFNSAIIEKVALFLRQHAKEIPIILDPVMIAKSGHPLLVTEAIDALRTKLIPIATLITPNLPEAFALGGLKETQYREEDMPEIAHKLLDLGSKAILLKGGHLGGDFSDDFYLDQHQEMWFRSPRVATKNTHGTGCTLSAAIAAYIAKGMELSAACSAAKRYLHEALIAAKDQKIGKGLGPVHHFWEILP